VGVHYIGRDKHPQPLRRDRKRWHVQPMSTPAILIEHAAAALRARRVDEAEQYARQALEDDCGNVQAAEILGRALLAKKRAAEAVAALREAATQSGDPGLQTLLAMALLAGGKRDEAVALLREVTARRPPFAPALLELAKVLMYMRDYPAAAEQYRHALVLRPGDAMARIALGKCLLQMRRQEEGEAALRTVVRTGKNVAGLALTTLASAPKGRLFLKPSAAAKFLRES